MCLFYVCFFQFAFCFCFVFHFLFFLSQSLLILFIFEFFYLFVLLLCFGFLFFSCQILCFCLFGFVFNHLSWVWFVHFVSSFCMWSVVCCCSYLFCFCYLSWGQFVSFLFLFFLCFYSAHTCISQDFNSPTTGQAWASRVVVPSPRNWTTREFLGLENVNQCALSRKYPSQHKDPVPHNFLQAPVLDTSHQTPSKTGTKPYLSVNRLCKVVLS